VNSFRIFSVSVRDSLGESFGSPRRTIRLAVGPFLFQNGEEAFPGSARNDQ
jgi:hypothetical protein